MNFAKEDSSSIDVQKYLRRRSGSKITTENVQVHELYIFVIKCMLEVVKTVFRKFIYLIFHKVWTNEIMAVYFYLLLRFSFDWEDNQTMKTELETSWNSLKILRYASFFHSLSFVLDVLDINMIGNGQVCNRTVYRICLKLSTKIPPIARDFILSPSIPVLFHTFH